MQNRTVNHRILGLVAAGLLTLTAVLAAGALLAVAAPTAAVAAERPASERLRSESTDGPTDLESARSRCLAAVDKRLTDLGNAASRLAAARLVTDEHEADLTAILDETTAGLEALMPDINAAADMATLKTTCRSMFANFRVYALVLPRTRQALRSARTDLRDARRLAGEIKAALRV